MKDSKIAFVGYDVVHPLQKSLLIRTSLKENNTPENNRQVFLNTITEIKKLVMALQKEFK